MPPTPDTRQSLLLRLRDVDDSRAWSEFVALYEPLIQGFARRRGLQDADARDLCQEVLRAVAQAIDRFEPNGAGAFRAWLMRIARNLTINFLAARGRQPQATGDSDFQRLLAEQPAEGDTAEFDEEYKRHVFSHAAQAVRGEFAGSTWQAFWRTAVEGEAIPVVAEDLGLSVGAVYIARSRAIARLRAWIETFEGSRVS